jgi:hypothetical protein
MRFHGSPTVSSMLAIFGVALAAAYHLMSWFE